MRSSSAKATDSKTLPRGSRAYPPWKALLRTWRHFHEATALGTPNSRIRSRVRGRCRAWHRPHKLTANAAMRDILFLSHRIPYPPDKGDKIRSWHILQHLLRRYRVHLGCLVDDKADFA